MWIFPTDDRRTPEEKWDWLMARVTKDMERGLYREAYILFGNKQDAADVYQDTLMRAAENCHKLRDESKLYSWMLKILKNKAKQHYKDVYAKTVLLDIPKVMSIRDRRASAEDRLLLQEKRAWLQAELDLLEPPDDVIFARHLFDEMTFEAIAAEIGMKPNTVKSRYRRVVERLKRKARGEDDEKNE